MSEPSSAFTYRMYFLYRIVTALSMIVLAPYYAVRGRRRGENSVAQRFGKLPPEIAKRAAAACESSGVSAIWIHAVSVGEVLAAKPLVDEIKQRFPQRAVFVSTTTETGQRLARERIERADGIFYFPLDWTTAVRRALATIQPQITIIMETEIWPNFLREAKRQGALVIFVNARISEKSFARFKRWEFFVGEFFARALRDADLLLAQSPEDAARLSEMGAAEEKVEVTGNLKYDGTAPSISKFGAWLGSQIRQQERWPVVIAGSVVEGEEEAVLAAYDIVQRRWRRALLVLAPRRPDRFDAAAEISSAAGWNVVRRCAIEIGKPLAENADVLVLDSIGELAGLYSLGDAAFVGGSLVKAGGHNILEPAWFSKPPVFGQSMENFREMAAKFLSAHAGVQVHSGQQLGKVWVQLIEDNTLRERMGRAARELSERNRGATARAMARISEMIGSAERKN